VLSVLPALFATTLTVLEKPLYSQVIESLKDWKVKEGRTGWVLLLWKKPFAFLNYLGVELRLHRGAREIAPWRVALAILS
jgi:hypothetical protein